MAKRKRSASSHHSSKSRRAADVYENDDPQDVVRRHSKKTRVADTANATAAGVKATKQSTHQNGRKNAAAAANHRDVMHDDLDEQSTYQQNNYDNDWSGAGYEAPMEDDGHFAEVPATPMKGAVREREEKEEENKR
jgi:hypothetical protein